MPGAPLFRIGAKLPIPDHPLEHDRLTLNRHCEERSDEAIQGNASTTLDCFATLAMTSVSVKGDHALADS
jgi:hypothetical protein